MLKTLTFASMVAGLLAAIPEPVAAKDKDKGKPAHAQAGGNGNKIDNPGKGPKAVPPGQIKRYTRGAKLPESVEWEDIGDLSKWKLAPLGKGNKYIRVDNEILEIAEDTQTVINTVGIVGDLLK